MSEQLKIRPLKRKDRVEVAAMIRKLVDRIGSADLTNLIVSDSGAERAEGATAKKDETFKRIGVEVVKLLLQFVEEDVTAWFASLLNVTVEELNEMDFDIEIQIIEQLVAREEANRFFTGALRLSKTMKQFAGKFSTPKQP